ncbi:MAG TPA: glutamine--tRNA ligase/YqeY domain fusion protein [Bacilli bacterium]|jgi:glutaminyl-tRNA synthetase|nr:glutamine--tRNA ligase/YqeY domain fusion protein [Bacilli bacterium]HNZ73812.1 glutamine--tRNA ligase/YqeY domain fusion protein [Bacilli bacterium]HQO93833.1 glutamine--tRNA ligase/YqeY domain fusion protein [Bacilli bacterium]HQQ39130.1 glutamine--tRNA ligase/YqeY domain fusion protein [Bacilli bacterium]
MKSNFIKTIVEKDLSEGKVKEVVTRFPPEPNSYLHIGHARAIVVDFETARDYGGRTNLRFDDTNPEKEDVEYVDAIIEDVRWLGYEPDKILYGSDYFDEQYERAKLLIRKGLAYVDDSTQEEISRMRGSFTEAGTNSPYRNRGVEENLELFENMKNGKYKEGEKTLRAKIDMSHPNINMRDPIIYRILYIHHHRQGDKWCIYPMYDFAHPLQDAIEGITHSLCSIEFENHRPLYDWFVKECEMEHIPQQIEFGRLNIENTILSKRYFRELVEKGYVTGYDDPRMPTLRGIRRRGYTPEAIKDFVISAGLSKTNATVSMEMLEHAVREDLKLKTKRIFAVIDPIELVIDNYPEGKIEYVDVVNNQENDSLGSRKMAFSKYVYINRDDFIEEKPNKKWKRLALGEEVRLMNAYFVLANSVEYDKDGNVTKVHCTYDPETKSGSGFDARKPNGNIGYVEKSTAKKAKFNYFTSLFVPGTEGKDFSERICKNSWTIKEGFVENIGEFKPGDSFQFIRDGYYTVDRESKEDELVFNETVALKSSYK